MTLPTPETHTFPSPTFEVSLLTQIFSYHLKTSYIVLSIYYLDAMITTKPKSIFSNFRFWGPQHFPEVGCFVCKLQCVLGHEKIYRPSLIFYIIAQEDWRLYLMPFRIYIHSNITYVLPSPPSQDRTHFQTSRRPYITRFDM